MSRTSATPSANALIRHYRALKNGEAGHDH
jgi:hypothetical protein